MSGCGRARIALGNLFAGPIQALGDFIRNRQVERIGDRRQRPAVPDLAVRHEMVDGAFEAGPHGHDDTAIARLQELIEDRVQVLVRNALAPLALSAPEVRIGEPSHLLPLERLLEEAHVRAFRRVLEEIDLRHAVGARLDRVEQVEMLFGQDA